MRGPPALTSRPARDTTDIMAMSPSPKANLSQVSLLSKNRLDATKATTPTSQGLGAGRSIFRWGLLSQPRTRRRSRPRPWRPRRPSAPPSGNVRMRSEKMRAEPSEKDDSGNGQAEPTQPWRSPAVGDERFHDGDRNANTPDRMPEREGDQALSALRPSAGINVPSRKSRPSNEGGVKIEWSIRPGSSTPYASASTRIVGQPRPVRRATSRIRSAPPPYIGARMKTPVIADEGNVAEQVLADQRSEEKQPKAGATRRQVVLARRPTPSLGHNCRHRL